MYRTIRADKVVDTASSLRARVRARFPESGLLRVADELLDVARESQERCRAIDRPNVPLRIGVGLLLVGGVLGIAAIVVANVRMTDSFWDLSNSSRRGERSRISSSWVGIAFLVTRDPHQARARAFRGERASRARSYHRHAPAHQGSR
jgi:hypothetical protein